MARDDSGAAKPQVMVMSAAGDFPRGVRRSVDFLLDHVPPKYLTGIGRVVLTNASAMSRRRAREKVGCRRVNRSRTDQACALYHSRSATGAASIELFVDRIFDGTPRWAMFLPVVRETCLAGVLYHEIGHHIEMTQRPEYRDEEESAEKWASRLGGTYLWRRYWYLRPVLRLLGSLVRRRRARG